MLQYVTPETLTLLVSVSGVTYCRAISVPVLYFQVKSREEGSVDWNFGTILLSRSYKI